MKLHSTCKPLLECATGNRNILHLCCEAENTTVAMQQSDVGSAKEGRGMCVGVCVGGGVSCKDNTTHMCTQFISQRPRAHVPCSLLRVSHFGCKAQVIRTTAMQCSMAGPL